MGESIQVTETRKKTRRGNGARGRFRGETNKRQDNRKGEDTRREQRQKRQMVDDAERKAREGLEEAGGNFLPSHIQSCHLLVTTV